MVVVHQGVPMARALHGIGWNFFGGYTIPMGTQGVQENIVGESRNQHLKVS